MRLMVMPVGRSLGFFADHRQKIFRTLPITGEKYFVPYRSQAKPILVFSGSQAKVISYSTEHRQKIFRTLPSTGKNYFVLYRSQAKIFRTLPKRYFGLYHLVGGRKPYTIWNPIYGKDSWRDYPLPWGLGPRSLVFSGSHTG